MSQPQTEFQLLLPPPPSFHSPTSSSPSPHYPPLSLSSDASSVNSSVDVPNGDVDSDPILTLELELFQLHKRLTKEQEQAGMPQTKNDTKEEQTNADVGVIPSATPSPQHHRLSLITTTPSEAGSPLTGPISPELATQHNNGSGNGNTNGSVMMKSNITAYGKNKSSCHQCKSSKPDSQLLFCTNRAKDSLRKRRCRKKFCLGCLNRCYSDLLPADPASTTEFVCPSCRHICECASCARKGMGSGCASLNGGLSADETGSCASATAIPPRRAVGIPITLSQSLDQIQSLNGRRGVNYSTIANHLQQSTNSSSNSVSSSPLPTLDYFTSPMSASSSGSFDTPRSSVSSPFVSTSNESTPRLANDGTNHFIPRMPRVGSVQAAVYAQAYVSSSNSSDVEGEGSVEPSKRHPNSAQLPTRRLMNIVPTETRPSSAICKKRKYVSNQSSSLVDHSTTNWSDAPHYRRMSSNESFDSNLPSSESYISPSSSHPHRYSHTQSHTHSAHKPQAGQLINTESSPIPAIPIGTSSMVPNYQDYIINEQKIAQIKNELAQLQEQREWMTKRAKAEHAMYQSVPASVPVAIANEVRPRQEAPLSTPGDDHNHALGQVDHSISSLKIVDSPHANGHQASLSLPSTNPTTNSSHPSGPSSIRRSDGSVHPPLHILVDNDPLIRLESSTIMAPLDPSPDALTLTSPIRVATPSNAMSEWYGNNGLGARLTSAVSMVPQSPFIMHAQSQSPIVPASPFFLRNSSSSPTTSFPPICTPIGGWPIPFLNGPFSPSPPPIETLATNMHLAPATPFSGRTPSYNDTMAYFTIHQ